MSKINKLKQTFSREKTKQEAISLCEEITNDYKLLSKEDQKYILLTDKTIIINLFLIIVAILLVLGAWYGYISGKGFILIFSVDLMCMLINWSFYQMVRNK